MSVKMKMLAKISKILKFFHHGMKIILEHETI